MNALLRWALLADDSVWFNKDGSWTNEHIWFILISNIGIAVACFTVVTYITALLLRRKSLPFRPLFIIIALGSCFHGMTRIVGSTVFINPNYRLLGLLNMTTAIISLVMVLFLIALWMPINEALDKLLTDGERQKHVLSMEERLSVMARSEAEAHQFEVISQSVPDIVFVASPAGDIEFYNNRWYEFTGFTEGDSLGWGWKRAIHELDLPSCLQLWIDAVSTRTTFECQFRLLRQDGVYRYHLGRAQPRCDNKTGLVIHWYGSVTDIDDQLRNSLGERYPSLGELRSLIRESPEPGGIDE